jgi:DNA-binding PadR family transcriptional regulator
MVVLALVSEQALHPYRIRQLIREQGRETIVNVARSNSVYQAIEGLLRAGLVSVREASQGERRPERTVYAITDAGRATLEHWLLAMLATPETDYSDFPAALSFLPLLDPQHVLWQLEGRARTLEKMLATTAVPGVEPPRLSQIEEEYRRTVLAAELNWLGSVIGDLRSGRLSWKQDPTKGLPH